MSEEIGILAQNVNKKNQSEILEQSFVKYSNWIKKFTSLVQ